jgi:hypothetical protein
VCAVVRAIEGLHAEGCVERGVRLIENWTGMPYTELQESPLVTGLVQLQALVKSGRARVSDEAGVGVGAWLCACAPPWVLQAVVRAIGWEEVLFT